MPELDTHALLMIAVFIIGYVFITIEHVVRIDKATTALLTGIICWIIQYARGTSACGDEIYCLEVHMAAISQIVFFLLGALAIVELMSIHKGFAVIADLQIYHGQYPLQARECKVQTKPP